MALADVSSSDVMDAIREFDAVGRDAFLDKYGMGKARSYVLHYNGREYDSKAILAAAHGHHPGLEPLRAAQFSGGDQGAARYLRRLGFVVSSTTREPKWVRDELILACDLALQNNWQGIGANDERAQKLSDLLQRMPIHPIEVRGPTFRNPSGVARKTYETATNHPDYQGVPIKIGAGDLEVLRDFLERGDEMRRTADLIRAGIESGDLVEASEAMPDIDLEAEAREGRLLEHRHLARERDAGLRAKKIEKHLRTHGQLACETCGFDFKAMCGPHGDGYIECHHVIPLHASGETKTRLDDLILICSNCHRMIHRRTPWLTPEELRRLIAHD
jgi:5-methylcytosine-specific restriction enzyme A